METKTKHVHLEVKALGEEGSFEGYGSIFGNLDSYGDVVTKGAFLKSIKEKGNKIKLLWQHKSDQPIGVWESIEEDEKGLKMKGRLLLSVQQGREAWELLKAGALSGLSIGYQTVKEDYKDGIRYLKEIRLLETSIVTFPANTEANVTTVKSLFEDLTEEDRIKVVGFINNLKNKSLDCTNEPPITEASEEKHSEETGADSDQLDKPDEGISDFIHSLRQLKDSLLTK